MEQKCLQDKSYSKKVLVIKKGSLMFFLLGAVNYHICPVKIESWNDIHNHCAKQ